MQTKDSLYPIWALIVFLLISALLASGLLVLLGIINGVDYLQQTASVSLNILTTQLVIQHFFFFIIPGALTIYLFSSLRKKGTFALKNIDLNKIGLIVLLFVLGLPQVGVLTWLNNLIPLSGNMEAMESQVNGFLKTLLSSGNMALVVFLIGLVPAIGEELVFRGVIQKTLENWTKKPHLAIFLSGAIFSLIHFQFAGFLPRMFLGMLLGYAYYFSKSILVPMLLHFAFNAFQAVAMVLNPEMINELGDTNAVELSSWWIILLTIIGFVFVIIQLLSMDKDLNKID